MGTSRYIRARQLMSRETIIDAPFTGGIATDLEYYQLAPQQTTFAQDLIAPNGIATQRRGWTYDGTTADAGANNLLGVARQNFVLSGQTRTVTTTSTVNPLYIHNPSSAGTSLITTAFSGVIYLPRCVYRDELIFCGQDGLRPIIRYSGSAATSSSVSNANLSYTAGQSILTTSAGSFNANTTRGSFVNASVGGGGGSVSPSLWLRVLERNSSTSLTLEGIKAGSSITGFDPFIESAVGFAYPAVNVYNAGTVTITGSNTATGTGTKWLAVVAGNASNEFGNGDSLLVIPSAGGVAMMNYIYSASSDTVMSTWASNTTNSSYAICRRLPFKDAAAHRGSLWGTGVAQYPDRVYVSPPGWNPSLPPGFTEPLDPVAAASSVNANDFLLSYVDVPSPFDGDANIAILPSAGPLLVLKRHSVYGVYGSYPSFQVSLVPGGEGAGCANIRAAISTPEGQFWASDLGVFTYRNGQVVDLTRGRINREWRARFRSGVNFIALGVVANHLLAYADGSDITTYVYDLVTDRWMSKLSNFIVGGFWRSKVPGEADRLLGTIGTRVINVEPIFDISNAAGAARDANGTSPRFHATTGPALAQAAGIDGEAKLLDVSIDANLYDSTTPTTVMSLSVIHSGALENPAQRTKFIGGVGAATTNLVTRTRIRDINRSGRLHSFDADVVTTDAENVLIEVPQLVMTWRDTRSGT